MRAIERHYLAIVNIGSVAVLIGVFARPQLAAAIANTLVSAGVTSIALAYIARLWVDQQHTNEQSHAIAEVHESETSAAPEQASLSEQTRTESGVSDPASVVDYDYRRLVECRQLNARAVLALARAKTLSETKWRSSLVEAIVVEKASTRARERAALIRELIEPSAGELDYHFVLYPDGRIEIAPRKRDSVPDTHRARSSKSDVALVH